MRNLLFSRDLRSSSPEYIRNLILKTQKTTRYFLKKKLMILQADAK